MQKGIKILHAITRLDKGGSATNTLLSSIGLVSRGYEIDVLYGHTEDADQGLITMARDAGVGLIVLRELVRDIHPVMDMAAFVKTFGIMRKNRYDIVHAHSSKSGAICRIAAKCAGVKKIVYTPHGHVFYGYFGKWLTQVFIFLEKMLACITDRIIGLTQAECDEWLGFGIGRKDKYTAIPSGIRFDKLECDVMNSVDWRQKLGIQKEAVVVGSIGRFTGIKGYRYFIEAAIEQARKRDNVVFVLAGDGPLKEKYEGMIRSAGIGGKFHIIPWQENIGAVIKAFDIFVLSSLNEGMGRVLVEAMFLAKPVIATRVGGVPSLVPHGCGILVEPASSNAISEAIGAIIRGPEEARAMAEKARVNAVKNYSADKMTDDLGALYEEVLSEKA